MQIYLPIAEMAVSGEVILLLGLVVGFLSGVFGVGGGFLTTPFLIFLGIPPAIAVGSQSAQLIASSVSGVLGHWRKGNVDFRLGAVMLAGSIGGSILGILIFRLLQYVGQINLVISLLYVFLLGGIGLMMLAESVNAMFRNSATPAGTPLAQHPMFQKLPYKMRFPNSRLYISALVPGAIGFVGGLLVSIMGIGGGFLLVPAMIYILGMPTLLVAGTSLFQIMFTTAFATMMHAVANHTVDIMLAVLLISGSVVGVQAGVWAARYIKGAKARVLMALMLLVISSRLAGELFIQPADLYSVVMR